MGRVKRQEQIKVLRFEDFVGIELRSGVAVKEPYPRHWHEEYQFCFIQDGGGELCYRGVNHNTPSTSLFVVHPGEVHSNHTNIGCTFRSIYVAPELIRKIISSATGREQTLPFFPDPMIFDNEVIDYHLALHDSFENDDTTLKRESVILEMLVALITRHSQEKYEMKVKEKKHYAINKVRDYIVEFYAQNISLEELAEIVNLSPFHLNRVFTKEIGMPPHAFQTQMRIASAKRLIQRGFPLSSVAAMTGFTDQSHFIRHFKRLMKITPGEYLKTARTYNTERV